MGDNVNHPNHYQNIAGVEAIDILNDLVKDLPGVQAAMLFNTTKYLLRFQKKNGVEDLKKAQNYLQWLIDEIEGMETTEDKRDVMLCISDIDNFNRPTKIYFKWFEHAKCTQVNVSTCKAYAWVLKFQDVLPCGISKSLDNLPTETIKWVNLSKTVLRSVMPYDEIDKETFKYCLELEWKEEEK